MVLDWKVLVAFSFVLHFMCNFATSSKFWSRNLVHFCALGKAVSALCKEIQPTEVFQHCTGEQHSPVWSTVA